MKQDPALTYVIAFFLKNKKQTVVPSPASLSFPFLKLRQGRRKKQNKAESKKPENNKLKW